MKQLKVGDHLLISHPSAQYDYYMHGIVRNKIKDTYEVHIFDKKGLFAIDYTTSGEGFINIWGMSIEKVLKWKKR